MSIRDVYKKRIVDEYKSPEVIPKSCSKCKYFKKTGIIDIYRGRCSFFNEDRFSNYPCIAFDYLKAARDNAHEKIREDINQRLMPEKELKDLPTYQINDNMSESQILFSSKGRINRRPYWGITIIFILLSYACAEINIGLYAFVSPILLYPYIAVNIKRCHDIDLSGWFVFLLLIPIINILYLIDAYFCKGTNGDNRFGTDPLS